MKQQETGLASADSLTTFGLAPALVNKHLTAKEQQRLRELESSLTSLRAARGSAEKKRDRLRRKIAETQEAQVVARLSKQIADAKAKEQTLETKAEGLYEQALVDVPGETLIDKVNHIAGRSR